MQEPLELPYNPSHLSIQSQLKHSFYKSKTLKAKPSIKTRTETTPKCPPVTPSVWPQGSIKTLPLNGRRIYGRTYANHTLHDRARWSQPRWEAGGQVVRRMDFFYDGLWIEALGDEDAQEGLQIMRAFAQDDDEE